MLRAGDDTMRIIEVLCIRKVEASESVAELTSFNGVEIEYVQYEGECSDPRAIECEY